LIILSHQYPILATKFKTMASVYENYSNSEKNDKKLIMKVRPEILKRRFLELYMLTAHIGKTCAILGMCNRTLGHWRNNDEQFAADFEAADKIALYTLEDEAVRRAAFGVEKPVYQSGKLAGYTREYSDTLMVVLLKARAPHKYKERFSGELTGADGKPLSNELKVLHVHAHVPLANSEEAIIHTPINPAELDVQKVKTIELKENDDYLDDLIGTTEP